jgi:hypothetical protein
MTPRRFTMGDIEEHVPHLHGTPTEREHAQRELLAAADYVLAYWARSEWQRASLQFADIELEDIRQLVAMHFLLALDDLNVERTVSSPTNWLFQRVANGTRREVTSTYGQVTFSRYFLDNARRVRAIRSRLSNELGRIPTDEEILAASGEAHPGGVYLGPKDRQSVTRRPLTASFLKTFHKHEHALESTPLPEDSAPQGDPMRDVVERAAADSLRQLYQRAAQNAGFDHESLNAVFCCFGIAPHPAAHDVEEAAALCSMSAGQVRGAVKRWARVCTTPGGAFHKEVAALDYDTAADLGLADIREHLGEYPGGVSPVDSSLPLAS